MTADDALLASPEVKVFRRKLEETGKDYFYTSSLPASHLIVEFIGPFQGKLVHWELHLACLDYLRQQEPDGLFPCPFIEIEAGRAGRFPIRVGLELLQIDEPTIRKTIIMIRNYKRLAIGRLEFRPQLQRE